MPLVDDWTIVRFQVGAPLEWGSVDARCGKVAAMATKDHQMSASSAHGISFFAGLLLIIAGVFQAIEALSAIVHDQYLVVAPRYIYTFDLTAWGWIHLLIGLALIAVGICLLLGQGWA